MLEALKQELVRLLESVCQSDYFACTFVRAALEVS